MVREQARRAVAPFLCALSGSGAPFGTFEYIVLAPHSFTALAVVIEQARRAVAPVLCALSGSGAPFGDFEYIVLALALLHRFRSGRPALMARRRSRFPVPERRRP